MRSILERLLCETHTSTTVKNIRTLYHIRKSEKEAAHTPSVMTKKEKTKDGYFHLLLGLKISESLLCETHITEDLGPVEEMQMVHYHHEVAAHHL